MGCDKTENLPDPSSFDAVDNLSLSIRRSGVADYNGVIQGGFSSGANVTSFPCVSSPAVCPLPGNVNETNNFQMVDLINLNTLHRHHLEPNLMNVRNISPGFSSPSEMPHCMEISAEMNHSLMNNTTPTSEGLMIDGLSMGIQNPGVSMNFMPVQSSGVGCFETAGKATGTSQNSFQASGSPFGIGYDMQNTKSIGGIGIHNDAKVNPFPFPSLGNADGNFLTLGVGSDIKDRSNLRFSGKEVSSTSEDAVLPQTNISPFQQMRRNFPSSVHGVPGGITNIQRGRVGLLSSARNSSALATGSRVGIPPFMYVPDVRLNSSNTRNLGAVGKADQRISEPDPLKYAQGGLQPPPLPFSSNSTLPPHFGFGRVAAAPESDNPFKVAAQSTINQLGDLYTNISRNQPFMGSPIVGQGGRVRQDHLGQQSLVNGPHPWGNNLFPEGMGAQIAGWSGIQPAPDNQFPKRLGVQLNDGAITQATREGVLPDTGGIQQFRRGNMYKCVDQGPKMQPTEPFHPPFAMGPPQGGSPATHNVSGLPYLAGQGTPIPKVDGTPQASYLHGHSSLKRRASSAPHPTARQRRRTLIQHSNHQLVAHQRQISNSPVSASSPLVKRQAGLEESADEAVGEKCLLCKRGVAFNPEGPFAQPAVPPPVAVLPCGHVFHDHCLELITPKDQSKDPPCIPCALGENIM